ncbi:MAG: hypothetical protein EHM12_03555 [Dehalococcoidia bacterium]|nr:MAG: hypothetical protein EHM12_03555 [Dehalococcoidia bacterium]
MQTPQPHRRCPHCNDTKNSTPKIIKPAIVEHALRQRPGGYVNQIITLFQKYKAKLVEIDQFDAVTARSSNSAKFGGLKTLVKPVEFDGFKWLTKNHLHHHFYN